ncbi:MAG: hypothetical protein IKX36_06605 [Prevotella sp.]|nr:hypothetical protein [Prevotella sp.]
MKSNNFIYTICVVFSMCFLICCGNKHIDVKTAPVEEEMDSLDIELAEREARMMEMESWPWIDATDFPVDSIDIRIDDLSLPMLKRTFTERGHTIFVLSDDDFNMARKLVKDYFQGISVDDNPDSDKPYPYNFYFKQYLGYIDPDTGHNTIVVNMLTDERTPHGWAGELKNNWYVYNDGGKAFGYILIDMKQKCVVSFSLNGSV